MERITVKEKDKELHYTYEAIMNYHGIGFPAGVAFVFQAMRRAFPLLADGEAPERREIVVRTAFTGLGGRDALEMVTRCLTDGRLLVDGKMPEAANAVESPGGHYYFVFTYRGRAVAVQLNPALGHEDFNCLARKNDKSAEDEAALSRMRLELAERVLKATPEEAYLAERLL